jgi:outer membrane lipoprotein-sorting protein
MLNRFLRTAPTHRLMAALAGVVVAIAAGTAIAVAAAGGGPVPKSRQLADAIHEALTAKPVQGVSADVSFTNRLIDTSEIQGSDPLLTGGSGHIWVSNDGRVRLELYGDNGDPEVVLGNGSWWVYDPMLQTVYEGNLPPQRAQNPGSGKREALPSVARIQSEINQLATHLKISGAIPSDVGGQPAYTVKLAPAHSGGLVGQVQVAWDALAGVPLRFAVYRRGDSTPVLELAASGVSYGPIAASTFTLSPPAGSHVVRIATPASGTAAKERYGKSAKKHADITGAGAVAGHLSFKLAAPSTLAGLQRQSVSLLDSGSKHGALVVYGKYLGGIAVIEEPLDANGTRKLSLSTGSGEHARGIALPAVKINGASGQELDTALGTIVRFTSGNVAYTVIGSVPPSVADAAARGL